MLHGLARAWRRAATAARRRHRLRRRRLREARRRAAAAARRRRRARQLPPRRGAFPRRVRGGRAPTPPRSIEVRAAVPRRRALPATDARGAAASPWSSPPSRPCRTSRADRAYLLRRPSSTPGGTRSARCWSSCAAGPASTPRTSRSSPTRSSRPAARRTAGQLPPGVRAHGRGPGPHRPAGHRQLHRRPGVPAPRHPHRRPHRPRRPRGARQPPLPRLRLPRLLGRAGRRATARSPTPSGWPGRACRRTGESYEHGLRRAPAPGSPRCSPRPAACRRSPRTTHRAPPPATCPASSPATASTPTAARCPAPHRPPEQTERCARGRGEIVRRDRARRLPARRPARRARHPPDGRAVSTPVHGAEPMSNPAAGPRSGAPRARRDPRPRRLQGRARARTSPRSAACRWSPGRCARAWPPGWSPTSSSPPTTRPSPTAARGPPAPSVVLRARPPSPATPPPARPPSCTRWTPTRRCTARPSTWCCSSSAPAPSSPARTSTASPPRSSRTAPTARSTVAPFHGFVWRDAERTATDGARRQPRQVLRPRRQDRPQDLLETGAAYAMDAAGFRKPPGTASSAAPRWSAPTPPGSWRSTTRTTWPAPARWPRSSTRRARRPADRDDVDAVVLDFDGTQTDDRVLIDADGREIVAVHRGDGLGIAALRRAGLHAADPVHRDQPGRRRPGPQAAGPRPARHRPQGPRAQAVVRGAGHRARARALRRQRRQRPAVLRPRRLARRGRRAPTTWCAARPARSPPTPGGHGAIREIAAWLLGPSLHDPAVPQSTT